MPSLKDEIIFACGVVNNAIQSGRVPAPDSIRVWLQGAQDAFRQIYGEPDAAPEPYAAPASSGPAKAFGEVAKQVLAGAGGGTGVPPETKPFNMWGGDKAYIGWKDKQFEGMPEPEVCWGTWLSAAKEGHERAKSLLEKAASSDPNSGDPKWHQANARRVARARAVLAMLK
jgi:hypothetical protein